MNDTPNIVALMVALMASIMSDTLARQVGPYVAIGMVAAGGAMIAMRSTHDVMSIPQSLWYVLRRIFFAQMVTVSIAQLVSKLWPAIEIQYSLVPIALLIGWVKDYNAVLESAWSWITARFGRKDNA